MIIIRHFAPLKYYAYAALKYVFLIFPDIFLFFFLLMHFNPVALVVVPCEKHVIL